MNRLQKLLKDSAATGALTAATTSLATAACGQIELGNAAAPINAISHIAWGDRAARRDGLSLQYTLTGAALHGCAMLAWAGVTSLFTSRKRAASPIRALAQGTAVAAAAYAIDYYVVPKRFTPGFEKRLSRRSLFAIYAVLALSLAAGQHLAARDE